MNTRYRQRLRGESGLKLQSFRSILLVQILGKYRGERAIFLHIIDDALHFGDICGREVRFGENQAKIDALPLQRT